jgi:hypothetical protein
MSKKNVPIYERLGVKFPGPTRHGLIFSQLAMPRDGSMILSDVRGSTLWIVCTPCGRCGRYNVDKLMAEPGDAKLTDLLVTLANCEKARSRSVYDRCKAVFEGL